MVTPKTFAIPLRKKRTDFSFKSFLDDTKTVGEIYRRIGNPWIPVIRDPPDITCSYCDKVTDHRGVTISGSCNSTCVIG